MSIEMIQSDLSEIKSDVKQIQHALKQIAVQDNELHNLGRQIDTMWAKHDQMKSAIDVLARHEASCPRSTVHDVQKDLIAIAQYQASCPRRQIATLWLVVIPQTLVLIGITLALIQVMLRS